MRECQYLQEVMAFPQKMLKKIHNKSVNSLGKGTVIGFGDLKTHIYCILLTCSHYDSESLTLSY